MHIISQATCNIQHLKIKLVKTTFYITNAATYPMADEELGKFTYCSQFLIPSL